MEKRIIHIESSSEIEKILEIFTPCLKSLSSGEVNKRNFAQKLSSFGNVFVITDDTGCMFAFSAFYCNDIINKKAFLSLIAVKPEFTRMGLGNMMLDFVSEYVKKSGMTSLFLEVRKTNSSAVKFYKNQDFEFIDDESEYSYYMRKIL
ncbi:MAG: GNAT family N-acetyltransferase [Oscillospiraceae bacterium]|nr:GNAT family N-acetyltransferase [Oscillospiraceae bacterium]